MDLGLKNKRALITGSGAGIGAGIARALAQEGCNVVICDINEEQAKQTAESISKEYGVEASYKKTNMMDKESIVELFDYIDTLGNLDILVNNAGGVFGFDSFDEVTDDNWYKTQNLILDASYHSAKLFVDRVKQKGLKDCTIINVSSKTAVMSMSKNAVPYATFKAAIIGLTRSMAKDLYPLGIRVNCIVPGYVQTEKSYADETDPNTIRKKAALLTGEFTKPSQIGSVVTFLCSTTQAHEIIGAVIDITGGNLC